MGVEVSNVGHLSGCWICGKDLFYTPNIRIRARCVCCGKTAITQVLCVKGHYVCDDCHREDILTVVEKYCISSNCNDPMVLASEIFKLSNLNMHGPEYHSIVPAILVTAWGNSTNSKSPTFIRDAIHRGKKTIGGMCGTHGACGAGIGVGIAYAIINQVTPYSKDERGKANLMTSIALQAISNYGGPRCCKRDSMIAIEVAKKQFGDFEQTSGKKYTCEQHINNEMCIKRKCPYYVKEK